MYNNYIMSNYCENCNIEECRGCTCRKCKGIDVDNCSRCKKYNCYKCYRQCYCCNNILCDKCFIINRRCSECEEFDKEIGDY